MAVGTKAFLHKKNLDIQKESSVGLSRWWWDRSIFPMRKGWEMCDCSAWRRALRGSYPCPKIPEGRVQRKHWPVSGQHKLEHRRFPLNTRQHFCAVLVLEHWHGWLWILFLGDFQKIPGYEPGHPALDVSAWAAVGPDEPRGSFQREPYCDSLILWIM